MLVAYLRAGAKAADTGIDREAGGVPSLWEDDVSFATRDDEPKARGAGVPRRASTPR